MGELIVVEVLDRAGRVVERVRLSDFPASIGRACDGAVVIDDPYVSPQHLRIERDADGAFWVADTRSENGSYLSADNARITRAALTEGMALRIGHTRLRLRRADAALAPTLIDDRNGDTCGHSINRGRVLAALLLVSAIALFVQLSWNTYTQPKPAQLLFYVFVTLLVLLIWAGGWALASRVFAHRPAFFAHGAIAVLALLAWMVYDIALDYYRFAFGAAVSAEILNYAGAAALLTGLFAAHLRFTSAHQPRPRRLLGGAIASVLIGLGLLLNYVSEMEFSALPSFDGVLKPPAFRVAASRSMDRFFGDALELRKEIARLKTDE